VKAAAFSIWLGLTALDEGIAHAGSVRGGKLEEAILFLNCSGVICGHRCTARYRSQCALIIGVDNSNHNGVLKICGFEF